MNGDVDCRNDVADYTIGVDVFTISVAVYSFLFVPIKYMVVSRRYQSVFFLFFQQMADG